MAFRCLTAGLLAAIIFSSVDVAAATVDVDALKKEVERIREEIKHQDDPALATVSKLDTVALDKYGPNDKVTTRTGALTVSGLVQVWYQAIQNDSRGIIVPVKNGNNQLSKPESGSVFDNDTFRIRRTELRFALDITDNISAYVMMDPSREANTTFTPVPANPNHNLVFANPFIRDGSGRQLSNSIQPQLMQDAFISVHDLIPHHDFQMGQFKPPSGEEAWRSSGLLDFVDRSMVTAINNVRDIGVMVHGTWFPSKKGDASTGRLQYWFGAFNGPNGTVLTDPELVEGGNRSDDNNAKDFCWRIAGQPIWNAEKWYGRLEVGVARTDGYRGKSGNSFNPNAFINSIDRTVTAINRQAAWAWYRPGGPVKGWWLRGEWGSGHDRYAETSFRGADGTTLLGFGQLTPAPVTASGWFFSTGYKLSQSVFAESFDKTCPPLLGKALKNSEFTYRYETYQNIATESLTEIDTRTNLFKTAVNTVGYNYYIDGYKTRLQANYFFVNEPREPSRGLRGPRADMFVINFQVSY
jgi:hypothetical protein